MALRSAAAVLSQSRTGSAPLGLKKSNIQRGLGHWNVPILVRVYKKSLTTSEGAGYDTGGAYPLSRTRFSTVSTSPAASTTA
jgi:hypothetical protein